MSVFLSACIYVCVYEYMYMFDNLLFLNHLQTHYMHDPWVVLNIAFIIKTMDLCFQFWISTWRIMSIFKIILIENFF